MILSNSLHMQGKTVYHSFMKERPWAEHLTSLPKRGMGALSMHLTMKEHPCHAYSDLMSSKQIIGQTIMYNGASSRFKVKY